MLQEKGVGTSIFDALLLGQGNHVHRNAALVEMSLAAVGRLPKMPRLNGKKLLTGREWKMMLKRRRRKKRA